jgi:predicted nucleotidyltransferase
MKKHNFVIELLKQELPILTSKYGVKRIGVFGSFAKGTQKKNSDIDIVIEFESPIGLRFIELADHRRDMARVRNKDIDFYFGVNYDIVWSIAKDELPRVGEHIGNILNLAINEFKP